MQILAREKKILYDIYAEGDLVWLLAEESEEEYWVILAIIGLPPLLLRDGS